MIVTKESLGSLKEIDFKAGTALLINKPLEWTSFQVVNKIRWVISKHLGVKKFKVGHAGTLDPLASGLLILCTGAWTKKLVDFQGLGKTYSGEITLGATRPSYDKETEIDATFPTAHIMAELIEEVKTQFMGEFMQMPPIYSAKQIGGKRAYTLARAGKEVKISANPVTISRLDFDSSSLPLLPFTVDCGKGTYIRSLAYDMGLALESGGYLSALCRDAIGPHQLTQAIEIGQFEEELLRATSL